MKTLNRFGINEYLSHKEYIKQYNAVYYQHMKRYNCNICGIIGMILHNYSNHLKSKKHLRNTKQPMQPIQKITSNILKNTDANSFTNNISSREVDKISITFD